MGMAQWDSLGGIARISPGYLLAAIEPRRSDGLTVQVFTMAKSVVAPPLEGEAMLWPSIWCEGV